MWDWFDSAENGKGLRKNLLCAHFGNRLAGGRGVLCSTRAGVFFPHFKHCELVDVPLLQAYIMLCYGFCHVPFTLL